MLSRTRSSLFGILAAVLMAAIGVSAAPPDLSITPVARDGQLLVSFALTDGLTSDLLDAIQSGLSTSFSYQIELRRSAALVDRTVASVTVSATVRFDNLTRRYQMFRSVDGRVEDARPTEDQRVVGDWLTRFERIPVTATTALEPDGEYYVRVRANARPRSTWFSWPWSSGSTFGLAKFTFIP